ncbi:MAG: hypothetical protein ACE5FB_01220 [Candidatus Binatia bacterium]
MKTWFIVSLPILAFLVSLKVWAGDIEDVTFLSKVQSYVTIVDTVLVTQGGQRIPITKGTKINVAGFTKTEAFVISRRDKPNAYVKRTDIVAVRQKIPR